MPGSEKACLPVLEDNASGKAAGLPQTFTFLPPSILYTILCQ